MASHWLSCSRPSSGIMRPVRVYTSQLQSKGSHSNSKPKQRPAASSTLIPSGTTSLPIPSPGITALRRLIIYTAHAGRVAVLFGFAPLPGQASYASVPGAAAFSVMVPAVCNDDSREIFGIFPAHLTPETKAEGSAKVGGQGLTIHAISEQRLRMESVCHVVGFPQCAHKCPALIGIRKWLEDDVSCLRTRSGKIQHGRQPHAGPFGNVGPALLAGVQQYMTFGRQALELFERKRYGTCNQPLDRQAPVLETVREKSQIFFVRGMPAVHRWDLRNVTAFEFASQRLFRGDETLRGIRKRFPDP